MDDFKKASFTESTRRELKCIYLRNSRWKNDKRMFNQISRAKLKRNLKREIENGNTKSM